MIGALSGVLPVMYQSHIVFPDVCVRLNCGSEGVLETELTFQDPTPGLSRELSHQSQH